MTWPPPGSWNDRDMVRHAPDGYFAPATGRLGAIVLHEAYGLLSPMSNVPEVCHRLAIEGFPALAPDLYQGAMADTVDDAVRLMAGLDVKAAMARIRRATRTLRERGADRVAVVGFCMGGGLSFRAALEIEGLSGAVVFYGTPNGDLGRLRVPVLGHFALRDAFLSLEAVRRAESELLQLGKPVSVHYYDAEHGFMNEKLTAYIPQKAALAWERTLRFLRALSGGGTLRP